MDETELPASTFRPCGVLPASGRDRVAACEIVEVAVGITREMAQTGKLFAFLTGIGEISAIDDDSIALFCVRLGQVPVRFGTSPSHFDCPVDDVIGGSPGLSGPPRDASTVARHRSRMMTLKGVRVPELEARVGSGYRVSLDDAECAAIAGWRTHAGYLAVTRLGRVVHAAPLPAFADDRSTGLTPIVRAVIKQAREGHAALTELGRSFVMTSHERRMIRIVPGFWATLK